MPVLHPRPLSLLILSITLGLSTLCASGAAQAYEATVAATPRFDIKRYQIEGNTLIPQEEINKILAPYIGQSRDFGDVQNALQALQMAYQKRGYNAVQVILPEQALEEGVIRITIIQQKIVSITTRGNHHFDDANILNSIPALKMGEPPNAHQVARSLRVANENPSKNAVVHFKTDEQDSSGIDATVRVIDEKPEKFLLTLDNSGNDQTKDLRIGIAYQNYNMFNRDHRLSAQFITTPQNDLGFSDMRVFALGYTIPMYERGDSVDFIAAYSDVDAGNLLGGALTLTSKGVVLGAHYNWNLDPISDYQHKLTFGLDYRDYRPDSSFVGINLTPEVSVLPVSATYSAAWKKPEFQLAYSFGVTQNISSVTKHGGDQDFANSPWLADADFTRYNWGADYTRVFHEDWQFHLGASGQFASDHLHPGEQFGLGGMDSVRGWHERAFSGDRGYRWTAEVISPKFGASLSDELSIRALAFYDAGHVSNLETVFDTSVHNTVNIASVGVGARFGYGKHLLGRLDYAVVVDGDRTSSPSATYQQSRDSGDTFLHVSLAWVW